MDPLIILIAVLAVPVLVLMFLRVNAAMVFLSLCLGSVLVQFVSSDAAVVLSSATAGNQALGGMPTNQSSINVALLLFPVVLTTIFLMRSVKGHARLALNLLPAIGVGVLGALLVVPLLSSGVTGPIIALPLWTKLQNLQTLIVSANALLALFALWMQRPKKAHVEDAKH